MDNRTIEEVRRNEDRLIDKNIALENINDKLSSALNSAESKLDLYKSVIDEVREYVKYNATSNYFDEEKNMFRREIDLLEILDKAKGE